jgi:hypothetical protein
MSINSIWQPNTGLRWLKAFYIPTLYWAKPFLKAMNFPTNLVERGEIFISIYTESVEKREALWDANKKLGYLPELDTAITQEFVKDALVKLEANVGLQAKEAFKNWAYRSLMRDDLTNALLVWRIILRRACDKSSWGYKLITPPSCLLTLCPKISHLVCGKHDIDLEERLRQLSPPSEQEANELGLDMSTEAQIVNEIIRNESTSAVLRCIADTLSSESERSEVVVWAEKQATEQQIPVHLLLGDMLLKPTGYSELLEFNE